MNPLIDQVWDQFRGSWRFRWLAVAVAAALALAGWLVVFSLADRYQAEASVFVDPRVASKHAQQEQEQDIDAALNFVRQSLLADPSLQRIAREAGLLVPSSNDFQQQQLIAGMRARIDISVQSANGREEDLKTAGAVYHIAYQDRSRPRSLRVVRILLDTLVNDTLAGLRKGAEDAQQRLESQIADCEKRLRTAEERMEQFKSRHIDLMPTEKGGYFGQLQKEQLQKEREAVSDLKTKLGRTQVRRGMPAKPVRGSGTGDLEQQIKEAQADYDKLRLRFTDKHPDVIAARERLEQLKQQGEVEGLSQDDADAAATSNPDVDIENLRTELVEHESKVAELSSLLATVPQVEAEFTLLNRDYEAQYTLLDDLRKARQRERDSSIGSGRFREVQPPAAPYGPVWPRRKLFLAAVLAGALGSGAALAYGLNNLFPVVDSSGSIARMIGVPLLGSVPAAFPERERRAFRRDLLRVSMATACLLVAFAVAVGLSQSGYRLSIPALVQRIAALGKGHLTQHLSIRAADSTEVECAGDA